MNFLRRWFACAFRPHIHGSDLGRGAALHIWACERCGALFMSHDDDPGRCLPIDASLIEEVRREDPWFHWFAPAIILALLLASCDKVIEPTPVPQRFVATYDEAMRLNVWILKDKKTGREYMVLPTTGVIELNPVPLAEVEQR